MDNYRTKSKLWITIAISITVVAAWYFLVYQRQVNTEMALTNDKQLLEEKIINIKGQLESAATITDNILDVETKWNNCAQRLVPTDSARLILERVKDIAMRNDLTINNGHLDFDPLLQKVGNTQGSQQRDRIKLILEGRGRFFQVGDFLDSLENEIAIAHIDNLTLYYQEVVNPEIYFKILLDVFVLCEESQLL